MFVCLYDTVQSLYYFGLNLSQCFSPVQAAWHTERFCTSIVFGNDMVRG